MIICSSIDSLTISTLNQFVFKQYFAHCQIFLYKIDIIRNHQIRFCLNITCQMMILIKKQITSMKIVLKYNSIIKLFTSSQNWDQLITFIQKEFGLRFPEYNLTYQDEEEDSIMICGNEDLKTAVQLNSKTILKVVITLESNYKIIENPALVEVKKEASQQIIQAEKKQQEKAQDVKEKAQTKAKPEKWRNHCRNIHEHHQDHHGHHKHSNEQFSSNQSSKHHSGHKKMFHRMKKLWNQTISTKVDERVKMLIPCIRAQFQGGNPIKLFSLENPLVLVHDNTECKSCYATPITGIRYKCLVCPNFSLCQNCEGRAEHDHNLLKIKKPEIMESQHRNHSKFEKFWRPCHQHRQGHEDYSSETRNKQFECRSPGKFFLLKKCTKLANIFGGQPQIYKEFVEKNMELRPMQTVKKYASVNKIDQKQLTKKMIAFKCNKLALCFDKKPEEFKDFIEKNIDLKPWQIKKILIESGTYQQVKKKICKQNKRQWEEKMEKLSVQKKDKIGDCKKQTTEAIDASNKSMQYEEKGRIFKTMVELFGAGKPYYSFIQKHFALGQQMIIELWLQEPLSHVS